MQVMEDWSNHTLFEHKVARKCAWYQTTLGQTSMINFVVVAATVFTLDCMCTTYSRRKSRDVSLY